ncbi:hypothetical protein MMC11_003384 [Xylographa trunciseda]|nr:hypothetical protein [Xylographa trunciseda]
MSSNAQSPKIRRISPLSPTEAKWTQLNKIEWTDQTGRDRIWEAASRKTRGKTGIDAVAIAPILRHPSRPASTLLILQYRPPVQAMCVEFPAGLIDEGESPEEAAVRELKEETGYEGKVLDCSPTIVADPGLTNANMQVGVSLVTLAVGYGDYARGRLSIFTPGMVTIEVNLKEGDKEPEQHLDEGEHIQRVIVPLTELYDKLQDCITGRLGFTGVSDWA